MSTDITEKPPTGIAVTDDGPLAYLMDTARFNHVWRIASAISAATLLPDHLRLAKNKQPLTEKQVQSNVLRIVSQAIRWGFDPYGVIDETYVVANKLGYQGKLIAAVVNARAGLQRNLDYSYSGTGDGRTVTVSGTFIGETTPRTITLTVQQAKTENKMWRTDPDQKLAYTGSTKWARRHAPEVMLGVLTDDDLDRIRETRAIDVASEPQSLAQLAGADEPKQEEPPEPPTAHPEEVEPVAEPEPPATDADLYFEEACAMYRDTRFICEADIIKCDADFAKDENLSTAQKHRLLNKTDVESETSKARVALQKRIGGEA